MEMHLFVRSGRLCGSLFLQSLFNREKPTVNENQKVAAPVWYMIVSGVFLAWDLFDFAVFALTMTMFQNREALEDAGLNPQQVELILSTPTWVNVAFGIAVVFGVWGCVALLEKKRLAVPLLIVSLLGVIAQNTYMYLLSDAVEIMGLGASPLVIAGAIALVPFAILSANKGWLM